MALFLFLELASLFLYIKGVYSWERDSTTGYGTLTTSTTGNVTRVTISNPPINMFDYKMMNDLNDFLAGLNASSTPPKVVIFSSSDPQLYINHIDLHTFQPQAPVFNATYSEFLVGLDVSIVNFIRNLPSIFIGEINGFATGAGNEFAVQLDMRFAGPKARLGAFETAVGLIHANGGIQFLTKLIGPGRAAEFLLSATDVDAREAAAFGWVNRVFETEDELARHVDKVAQRVALFPADALNATKFGIRANGPSAQSLQGDLASVERLVMTVETQKLLERFVELSDNQTRDAFELDLDATLVQLYG